MNQSYFIVRVDQSHLQIADAAAVARFWAECDPSIVSSLQSIAQLIDATVSGSPYLTKLILRHGDFLIKLMRSEPEVVLTNLGAECLKLAFAATKEEIALGLRIKKQQIGRAHV